MSMTATAESTETAVAETAVMELARIRPPRSNVREDFGDVEGLAESIRKTGGLLENLVVFRIDDGGTDHDVVLIAGERRYRAAQLAGCTTVPVLIRPRPSELERVELQVIENGDRLDLSTPELFRASQQMFDLGASDDRVAQTLGASEDQVTTLRAIVSLGPAVHELIANGDLTIAGAAPLAQLAGLGDEYIEHAVSCIHQGFAPEAAAGRAKAKHRRDTLVAEATAIAEKRKLTLIDPPKYGAYQYDGSIRRLGRGPASQYLDVPLKEHAKAKCHAAYIDEHAPNAKAAIVLVCTDAGSHQSGSSPVIDNPRVGIVHVGDVSPGQKAAETRRHRKNWSATHASRNVTVTSVIRDLPLDEAMGRVAWHVLQDEMANLNAWPLAGRLLGIELAHSANAAKVVIDFARESGERSLRAAVAVLTARAEQGFQQKDGLGYRSGVEDERRTVRDHFHLLQRHGYALTQVEVNHLDRYCQVRGFIVGPGDGRLIDALDDRESLDAAVDADEPADEDTVAGTDTEVAVA